MCFSLDTGGCDKSVYHLSGFICIVTHGGKVALNPSRPWKPDWTGREWELCQSILKSRQEGLALAKEVFTKCSRFTFQWTPYQCFLLLIFFIITNLECKLSSRGDWSNIETNHTRAGCSRPFYLYLCLLWRERLTCCCVCFTAPTASPLHSDKPAASYSHFGYIMGNRWAQWFRKDHAKTAR